HLGRQVDVDQALHAVAAEHARATARLPDQARVDLRAGLDFLVRVDAEPGEDHTLRADRHFVADRDALVQADVCAEIARAADDRTLDDRAAANVRSRLGHRTLNPRTLAQRRVRPEHGVRPDAGLAGDPAVVPDERRALDLVEVVEVDAFADPDVAAELNPGDGERDLAVEGVVVPLPVLIQVADVLPVTVEHAAVERP